MRELKHPWRTWVDTAVRPCILVLRLLPQAGAGLIAVTVVLNIMLGVLPVVFVVTTSTVIGHVPGAVAGGVGSAEWDTLVQVFLLATAAFLGQQALAPVQTALIMRMRRRVDGRTLDRLLVTTLGTVSIAPMEDATTLNELADATQPYDREFATPGEACGGFLALIARYLRLLAFAAIVGVALGWWAGIALLAATMAFRYGQRGGLRR